MPEYTQGGLLHNVQFHYKTGYDQYLIKKNTKVTQSQMVAENYFLIKQNQLYFTYVYSTTLRILMLLSNPLQVEKFRLILQR